MCDMTPPITVLPIFELGNCGELLLFCNVSARYILDKLINLCVQESGVVENKERVYRSFTKCIIFIITNLLQREHQKLRLCLTKELEPMFVTSVTKRRSESERCRIERYIFTHYR